MIRAINFQSLSQSNDYLEFRCKIPLRKLCVDPTRDKVIVK